MFSRTELDCREGMEPERYQKCCHTPKWPNSSVGRAADWKSACRWFNSTFGHHFHFILNIYYLLQVMCNMHRIEPQWLNYSAHPWALPSGFANAHEKSFQTIFSTFGHHFHFILNIYYLLQVMCNMHRIEPQWLNYSAHPWALPSGFANAHEKSFQTIFSTFGHHFLPL